MRRALGDVVGHGLDAAALAARLRSAWRALALAGLDQVAILGVLDRFLRTEGEQFTFASLAILVVGQNRRAGSLVLAVTPTCPPRLPQQPRHQRPAAIANSGPKLTPGQAEVRSTDRDGTPPSA